MNEEKDCTIIFNNGQPGYEFSAKNLDKALEWIRNDHNMLSLVDSIKTPWFVLTVWDVDKYNKIMDVFE